MKILIASELGHLAGGREVYLRNVAPLLEKAGHDTRFAFERPANGQPSISRKTAPWTLPSDHKAIDDWRPEVVFLNGLSEPQIEQEIASSYPTAYFPHSYYGTCISGTKCHMRPTLATCQRTFGAGCLVAYFPRHCGGRNPVTMLQRYWTERRRCANLAKFRAVMVASKHMLEEYRRHGVAADRLHLMPPFPSDTVPDEVAPNDRNMTGRVLMVGRLTKVKGTRLLVDALCRAQARLNRPLELVVAGDGPERAVMEAQAAARNLPARFVGWVDAEQRTTLMRSADLLIVPSLWPEPFGLVGIEAACVGLPTVGFAVGGIPDWLEPGVSGECAPSDARTADGLADATVRGLSDQNHWARLRHGAWEVARRFSAQSHLARLEALLINCRA